MKAPERDTLSPRERAVVLVKVSRWGPCGERAVVLVKLEPDT